MGRQSPGYRIRLLDADDDEAEEGEVCIALDPAPTGLMRGYQNDDGTIRAARPAAVYRTGDVGVARCRRLHHLCRPRRRCVQSLRLPHQPVRAGKRADRASRGGRGGGGAGARSDAARGAEGLCHRWPPASTPDRATALSIFRHLRERLAPFKRVRRIEFAELPKTISGKIRRVELRRTEEELAAEHRRADAEFREEDFPELAR